MRYLRPLHCSASVACHTDLIKYFLPKYCILFIISTLSKLRYDLFSCVARQFHILHQLLLTSGCSSSVHCTGCLVNIRFIWLVFIFCYHRENVCTWNVSDYFAEYNCVSMHNTLYIGVIIRRRFEFRYVVKHCFMAPSSLQGGPNNGGTC